MSVITLGKVPRLIKPYKCLFPGVQGRGKTIFRLSFFIQLCFFFRRNEGNGPLEKTERSFIIRYQVHILLVKVVTEYRRSHFTVSRFCLTLEVQILLDHQVTGTLSGLYQTASHPCRVPPCPALPCPPTPR